MRRGAEVKGELVSVGDEQEESEESEEESDEDNESLEDEEDVRVDIDAGIDHSRLNQGSLLISKLKFFYKG